jgi:hypothetical protein
MTISINCGSAPRLCVSHISTVFIHNSSIDERENRENAGMIFSMKLRREAKTFVVLVFNAFVITTHFMIGSGFGIKMEFHGNIGGRNSKKAIVVLIPFLIRNFLLHVSGFDPRIKSPTPVSPIIRDC